MIDENGVRRKLIIFTEPRDTLNYLADKIRTRLGKEEAVVVIHGGDQHILLTSSTPTTACSRKTSIDF